MQHVAYGLCGLLLAMLLLQMMPAAGLLRAFRRWRRELISDDECPKAAVILVLRGRDPFLSDCIERLVDLDYPNYEVRIVVDHLSDPAWEAVQEVIARRQASHVHVEPLREPLATCTLNCSSLVQALTGLDESHAVVAFCDADTNPHRSWLRELVTPLVKDGVDITTGQRWYTPEVASLGALVRYVWNAGTVVAMARISVWGGSFALTRECLAGARLVDCWRRCLGGDAMVYPQIRLHGFRQGFVPAVMMFNRETCDLGGFYRWVQRQMLVGRLYLVQFPIVLVHAIASTLILVASAAGFVAACVWGAWSAATWLGGGLACYLGANVVLLLLLERAMRRIARWRGEEVGWLTGGAVVMGMLAVPLTQFVYVAALLRSLLVRQFEWRGVSYVVRGPWDIRLIEYRPYRPPGTPADELASL